jgi:hypothetical protein
MFEILMAQEFSGCFMRDAVGKIIDLNHLCRPSITVVQPDQIPATPVMTSDRVFMANYRNKFCEALNQGKTPSESNLLAFNFAMDEVIKLRGDLPELTIEMSQEMKDINCIR